MGQQESWLRKPGPHAVVTVPMRRLQGRQSPGVGEGWRASSDLNLIRCYNRPEGNP